MSVAQVTEITAFSSRSFDDALEVGIKRFTDFEEYGGRMNSTTEVWVENGKITQYRVNLKHV